MMILLDPDLNSSASRKKGAARRHGGRIISQKDLQLPSSRALAGFLARAQAAVRLLGRVGVLLTTDAQMRRLNRQFRGKDKATDVLSFPATDLIQNPRKNREKGDLAISVETARRQGAAHGHSLETEICILMLHGLLHLNGFDHEKDSGEMARREQTLRVRLGLEQGLIERASDFRKGRAADPLTRPLRGLAQAGSESASQRVGKPARLYPGRKNKTAPSLGDRIGKARGAR